MSHIHVCRTISDISDCAVAGGAGDWQLACSGIEFAQVPRAYAPSSSLFGKDVKIASECGRKGLLETKSMCSVTA